MKDDYIYWMFCVFYVACAAVLAASVKAKSELYGITGSRLRRVSSVRDGYSASLAHGKMRVWLESSVDSPSWTCDALIYGGGLGGHAAYLIEEGGAGQLPLVGYLVVSDCQDLEGQPIYGRMWVDEAELYEFEDRVSREGADRVLVVCPDCTPGNVWWELIFLVLILVPMLWVGYLLLRGGIGRIPGS